MWQRSVGAITCPYRRPLFAQQHDEHAEQRDGAAAQHHARGELIVQQRHAEQDAEQGRQQRQRRQTGDRIARQQVVPARVRDQRGQQRGVCERAP
ncbi:MAG TPA: hypothetical protein VK025_15935, partial [Steroidobacter sp.]|nr:hypothetical protein [Steroidobacter sp.]